MLNKNTRPLIFILLAIFIICSMCYCGIKNNNVENFRGESLENLIKKIAEKSFKGLSIWEHQMLENHIITNNKPAKGKYANWCTVRGMKGICSSENENKCANECNTMIRRGASNEFANLTDSEKDRFKEYLNRNNIGATNDDYVNWCRVRAMNNMCDGNERSKCANECNTWKRYRKF